MTLILSSETSSLVTKRNLLSVVVGQNLYGLIKRDLQSK